MAYGLKYFAEYNRIGGGLSRLEIHEENFTITPTEIKCESVVFDWGKNNQDITDYTRPCSLRFGLVAERGSPTTGFNYDLDFEFDLQGFDLEFSEFYTNDETRFLVKFFRETGELYFQGYILPDIYSAPFKDPSYVLYFTASDRYNVLQQIEFGGVDPSNNLSLTNILFSIRERLKLDDLPIYSAIRTIETRQAGNTPNVINKIKLNLDTFFLKESDGQTVSKSCDEMLSGICKPFFAKFFQWKGGLYFLQTNMPGMSSYTLYEHEDLTTVVTSVETGSQDFNLQLIGGFQDGRPIYSSAVIKHNLGSTGIENIDNLILNGDFAAWQQFPDSRFKPLIWTYGNGASIDSVKKGNNNNVSQEWASLHGRSSNTGGLIYIQNVNNLKPVVNAQQIQVDLKFRANLTENSKTEDVEEYLLGNPVYAVIQIIIGATADANDYYLFINNAGQCSWVEANTYIRLRHLNVGVFNELSIQNIPVFPIEKAFVKIRLFNTLQTGSTDKYRFVTCFDDVVIRAKLLDGIDNVTNYYRYSQPTNYSSPFPEYEVDLGDGVNNFSSKVLRYENAAGTFNDLTKRWYRLNSDGNVSTAQNKKLLDWTLLDVVANVARPRIRLTGTVQSDDVSPLRPILINGVLYRVNSYSLVDHQNRFTLELEQVFI